MWQHFSRSSWKILHLANFLHNPRLWRLRHISSMPPGECTNNGDMSQTSKHSSVEILMYNNEHEWSLFFFKDLVKSCSLVFCPLFTIPNHIYPLACPTSTFIYGVYLCPYSFDILFSNCISNFINAEIHIKTRFIPQDAPKLRTQEWCEKPGRPHKERLFIK